MKNKRFRFAIGKDISLSETWTLWLNGSDVYLTANTINSLMKLSLHQSGVCQFALLPHFYDKYANELPEELDSRTILRWKKIKTPEKGGIFTASIFFAAYENWLEQPQPAPEKEVFFIPPPPYGWGAEVSFFFSQDNPEDNVEYIDSETEYIDKFNLNNGDIISMFVTFRRLPSDFFDFKALPPEQVLLAQGFDPKEEEDSKELSMHFIQQEREGSATIYSLHNMRMMSIKLNFLQRLWMRFINAFRSN